ncbi:hypothetical protein ABZ864_47645 [Streptomyces sp. NPDC047082]|uniref:hypothetical protein n=1 Tax=Streptomyces sp. NPDC047082 TaxID=3155259 RepID=UPI00340BA579
MPTQVLNIINITFPALMLALIIAVFLGRRRSRPNGWLLAGAAGFACAALATALGIPGHLFSSTWLMGLSGLYLVLAITVRRHPAAEDSQANEATQGSLTKDEAQP